MFSDNLRHEIAKPLKLKLEVGVKEGATKLMLQKTYIRRKLYAYLSGNVNPKPIGSSKKAKKINTLTNITGAQIYPQRAQ